MDRSKRISSVIKTHDRELYCEMREGKLCIMRKSARIEAYDVNGTTIHFVRSAPFFIFALTEDWRFDSEPRDWGLEPILHKIRSHDLWSRDLAGECLKQTEKMTEVRARERSNNNEAFLKDYRRQFAKTFDDVNTGSMDKTKDKRRLGEKNGNC